MNNFDILVFVKFKQLQSIKRKLFKLLDGNKLIIFCIYSEYELITDNISQCLTENIVVFPVYYLNDYYDIFHSFIQSHISTSVDFYLIVTNDSDLNVLIDKFDLIVSLSNNHGPYKLSHKIQDKHIYCLSYDKFHILFKNMHNMSLPVYSSYDGPLYTFQDLLLHWEEFHV